MVIWQGREVRQRVRKPKVPDQTHLNSGKPLKNKVINRKEPGGGGSRL